MTTPKTITREELYKLVWAKPYQLVAKELGISDVAVGKICRKLDVPKPECGYWRRAVTVKQSKPVH